jgi:hypothetical protein
MKFLGLFSSKDGIRLDHAAKIKGVQKFTTPKYDLGQLQSFLGMVGYFNTRITLRWLDIFVKGSK